MKKLNQQGNTVVIVLVTVILTALIVGGGMYIWQTSINNKSGQEDMSANDNQVTDSQIVNSQVGELQQQGDGSRGQQVGVLDGEKATTIDNSDINANANRLETIEMESILLPSGRIKISIKSPSSWDAFSSKPIYSISDGKSLLAKFSFKDDYGRGEVHTNENNFIIYDITNWMNVEETDGGPGSLSLADKKKMVDTLFDYRKTKQVSNDCPFNHIGRFLDNTATYVETIDNQFSGCAIVGVSPQDPSYDPILNIEMIGKVNDRYLYITGQFKLHDHFTRELDAFSGEEFPKYLEKFKNIMNMVEEDGLPEESQKEMNAVLQVMNSLKIREIK